MQHSWGIVVIVRGELHPQISAKLSRKSTLRQRNFYNSVGRCVDFFAGRKGMSVRVVGALARCWGAKKRSKSAENFAKSEKRITFALANVPRGRAVGSSSGS